MHTITIVFVAILGMIAGWNLFWFVLDANAGGASGLGIFFFVVPSWIAGVIVVVLYALICMTHTMLGHP